MNRRCVVLAVAAGSLQLGACEAVSPWQRGTLARPEMQFEVDALYTGLYEQIYDSKEGSRGSAKAAGAGCGCN